MLGDLSLSWVTLFLFFMQSELSLNFFITKTCLFTYRILKILPSKTESFQKKNSDISHISAQNIML